MLCYKDKTFCPFHQYCAHGDTCERALTDEVKEGAKKAGLYISSWCEEPKCFVDKQQGVRS